MVVLPFMGWKGSRDIESRVPRDWDPYPMTLTSSRLLGHDSRPSTGTSGLRPQVLRRDSSEVRSHFPSDKTEIRREVTKTSF